MTRRDDPDTFADRLSAAIERKHTKARANYADAEADREAERRAARSTRQVEAYAARERAAGRGTRLLDLRVSLGKTQREMAEAIGIARSAYRRVERGESTSVESRPTRIAIASYLTSIGTPSIPKDLRGA